MSSHRQCGAQGPPFSQRARTETESMNVLPWDSPVGPRWAAPDPAVNMSGRQSNTKWELARASLLLRAALPFLGPELTAYARSPRCPAKLLTFDWEPCVCAGWKTTAGAMETVSEARDANICVTAGPLTLLESPKRVLVDNGETRNIDVSSRNCPPPALPPSARGRCKQGFSFPSHSG